MAARFLYRYGETHPRLIRVTTAQGITLGDMVGASTGFLYGAGDEPYVTLSTSQFAFAANFAGVAAQNKTAGTARPGFGGGFDNRLRISTEGVFEFDTYASTLAYNDLVGPTKDTGSALNPQKVELVTDVTRAIGRVDTPKTVAASTTVFVRLLDKKMAGTPAS